MAWGNCEGGGGSVVVERRLKLWSLIIDRVSCGGAAHRKKAEPKKKQRPAAGSEKLSELLKQPEWWENNSNNEDDVRRKEQALEGLKGVAKKLQQQQQDEGSTMVEGAAEVRKLTKDDPHARITLALLGVIPPLVALLDAQDPTSNSQIAALYALLNLAIANDANKAAIVKAGAVHKMLKLIVPSPPNNHHHHHEEPIAEAVVANFLGLSALDSNKSIIGSSGAIPFLVETLKKDHHVLVKVGGSSSSSSSSQAKQDSLRALYNLSISPPSNVSAMLETDLIPYLFIKLGDMDMSERILSILGNIASVAEGRKGISAVADAFPILIDVLNWTDSPVCQEKACYVLMVMAHKSYGDRQAMIEAGIASSLLELTLLGSTLAQKRASRILECLRVVEKGKQQSVGRMGGGGSGALLTAAAAAPTTLSAPVLSSMEDHNDDDQMSQEKKAVKQLVQQSLHNNMKRMVKRANLPHHDFVPSDHFKSLTSTSTSKSLPF